MIKVLLSDDNTKLFSPWSEKAVKLDIDLVCFSNWEEAQFELNNNWNDYEFIILDGKGKIHEEGKEANSKHLIAASQWLKEQLGNGKYKPVIIYTGYYEAIEEIVIKDKQFLEIFDKGKTEIDEILNFILKHINKTPEKIIRAEHPEVFEVFDSGILSANMKNEFANICKEVKENNQAHYKGTLRRMRPIIENVLIELYKTDEYLVPKGYFKTGVPEVSGIIHHLSGKPKFNKDTREMEYHADKVLPEHISYVLNCLYDITSKVAMHDYDKEITNNLLKSSLFALIEFLLWFKDFYTKNYLK